MNPNAVVMLRVFARCASAAEAQGIQSRLLQALAPWQPVVREAPTRYWKMPELFEFTLAAPAARHVTEITALCHHGWADCGDEDTPSWVWNAEPGATFLDATVTWAEVMKDR